MYLNYLGTSDKYVYTYIPTTEVNSLKYIVLYDIFLRTHDRLLLR